MDQTLKQLRQEILKTLEVADPDNSDMYQSIVRGKYRRWISWLQAIESYTKSLQGNNIRLDFSDQRLSNLPPEVTQIEMDLK